MSRATRDAFLSPTALECLCSTDKFPLFSSDLVVCRYSRGVERARFPSEIHDALSSLNVAQSHVEAQKRFRDETRISF